MVAFALNSSTQDWHHDLFIDRFEYHECFSRRMARAFQMSLQVSRRARECADEEELFGA
jgi:hypothetical protein